MANRFWVGGTGTWDAADTTHWASSSGGAGGQSVPGSSDTVTLDASSGGGTVTVNATITVQSITCGAFTGTLDFSANDNNVTLSTSFVGSGTGTRTINLGDGTWTLTGTGNVWNMTTTTDLTFSAGGSTIIINNTSTSAKVFIGGALTYNVLSIAAGGAIGSLGSVQINNGNTFASLLIARPNYVAFASAVTQTITNAFTFTGASGSLISLLGATESSSATISIASGAATLTYGTLRDLTFAGGATFTATNSFDLGRNSGISITAPASGGGGSVPFGGDILSPSSGDGRYNLLLKIVQNTYIQCGKASKTTMMSPLRGDSEYNLYFKLAHNTKLLAS